MEARVFVATNYLRSSMIFHKVRIVSFLMSLFQVCLYVCASLHHSFIQTFSLVSTVANIEPNEKLAVMFWIHGGGYYDWSGNDQLFGPDFLIEKRVILVTFNYRLALFGFLSLGTPEYSGNMGMKDQQLALRWVYENIDQFNGDTKRITIFGESAGKLNRMLQIEIYVP